MHRTVDLRRFFPCILFSFGQHRNTYIGNNNILNIITTVLQYHRCYLYLYTSSLLGYFQFPGHNLNLNMFLFRKDVIEYNTNTFSPGKAVRAVFYVPTIPMCGPMSLLGVAYPGIYTNMVANSRTMFPHCDGFATSTSNVNCTEIKIRYYKKVSNPTF